MADQKKLHRKYMYRILFAVKAILEASPTIVDIPVPEGSKITVCGDVHGQYYDLMNIFEKNGPPSPENMYLVRPCYQQFLTLASLLRLFRPLICIQQYSLTETLSTVAPSL
jgi:hypothetical protein